MSHTGKIQRGELWYGKRDRDGMLPDGVMNDPVKLSDMEYYLEHNTKEVVATPPKKEIKEKKEG